MSRKATRRVMMALLLTAAISGAAGYIAAPAAPWVYAHLTPGSFLSEYDSAEACDQARQAFAAGRGFPTRGTEILITPSYTDFCLKGVRNFGAPSAR